METKVIKITGSVEVPFECNVSVTEEELENLLQSSFIAPYSRNEAEKKSFNLLYQKLMIDADDVCEIDIHFIEDEDGNSLNF